MRVIVALQALLAKEESLFRAQLLREDIARLTRLQALAREASDLPGFKKAGKRIGWTQADARTQELSQPLDRLLELVYRSETGPADEALEADIETAWAALHRLRMERLVGCLSTPVPRPDA